MSVVKEERKIRKLPWHQKLLLKKELTNKCHSFHQIGYVSVREDELLNYLLSYRWKKHIPDTIKACKQDILAIKPNDFFDYQQLLAQTSTYSLRDWHDVEDLF